MCLGWYFLFATVFGCTFEVYIRVSFGQLWRAVWLRLVTNMGSKLLARPTCHRDSARILGCKVVELSTLCGMLGPL